MPISDIPIFSMLRTRMHWHQERQRLLAENVANADTPEFRPRDLAPLEIRCATAPAAAPVALVRTRRPSTWRLRGERGALRARPARRRFEVRPTGNAVISKTR